MNGVVRPIGKVINSTKELSKGVGSYIGKDGLKTLSNIPFGQPHHDAASEALFALVFRANKQRWA